MRNFVQEGNTVTLTSPAVTGCKSGDLIIVGAIAGVAAYDAAAGAEVEVVTEGVFTLPKASGVINEGAAVWFNATSGEIENASGAGLYPIGTCAQVGGAGTNDATVNVKLSGIPVAAVAGG